MKRSVIYFAVLLSVFAAPVRSLAWGARGHGMVAEIAWYFMDSTTKQNVRKYLGTTTIEKAANWMDEIKSDSRNDSMKPMHYLDFEKGQQYEPQTGPNIINELHYVANELKNKDKLTAEQVKNDIMILFHLVGDMHQPLHIGYGSDKGGNNINVLFLGRETNLHRVWDSQIIESLNITANTCLKFYPGYSKPEVASLKKIDFEVWIRQPRSQLGQVYDFKHGIIDEAYAEKNAKVIENEILIAGLRLAALMDEIFKS